MINCGHPANAETVPALDGVCIWSCMPLPQGHKELRLAGLIVNNLVKPSAQCLVVLKRTNKALKYG